MLLLCIVTLFLSCDETVETPTPPAPAKHVNKLTCKINGETWEALPKKASGILSNPDLSASLMLFPKYPGDTAIYIIATNRLKQEHMSIGFPFFSTTVFSKNYDSGPFKSATRCTIGGLFDLDTTRQNKIHILSVDRAKNIMTGSFEFTCFGIPGGCKDTLHVTDGIFDLQYSY